MKHGTETAYNYHRCRCNVCRDAHTDWMREYRAANPLVRRRGNAQARAYEAAMQRVRDAHRNEFDRYYAAERKARGLS